MSDSRFSLLVVDDRVPAPEFGAGYPRMFSILNGLAGLGYRVTFFPMIDPQRVEPCASVLEKRGIEVICARGDQKPRFESFYAERKRAYDAVLISRPHNMALAADTIKALNERQKIVYDAEGLFAVRDALHLKTLGYDMPDEVVEEMVREEIETATRSADLIIAVSEGDRRTIKRYTGKPVITLGYVVDIQPTSNGFDDREDLLFVGAFLSPHSPNEDAVHYFAKDIFPRVHRELGAKFWIVGTNNVKSVWNLSGDNIIVTGRVDRVSDYYDRCRTFVVPTRFESGIPLKMFECMSFGLPAVVTPLIAEQMQLDDDTVLLGGDADQFAENVIRCYRDADLWKKLRRNGFRYIQKYCSKSAYMDTLQKLKRWI